jgi:pSer/pThr/pTyr-binding forkhead associated (FHA) protein
MTKSEDKTVYSNKPYDQSSFDKELGLSTTTRLSRKKLIGEIPVKQNAFLEIIGTNKDNDVIELGERDVVIGRSPSCRLRFQSSNVSRKHARIFARNDEYYIEDLGSTNGTYVNGIRIAKCALRKNDLIYIGGVRILFNE